MRLYFLRHGIAADAGEFSGPDSERPLTDEGRARMARAAKAIDDLTLDIERIVTSPLLRAKQTASLVAERLKPRGGVVEDERVGLSFGPRALGAILSDHADAARLMLVGHEPSLSQTIGHLLGGASVEVKKGALAGVELSGPGAMRGTLLCLIPPRALAR